MTKRRRDEEEEEKESEAILQCTKPASEKGNGPPSLLSRAPLDTTSDPSRGDKRNRRVGTRL